MTHNPISEDIVSVSDYEIAARQVLPHAIFEYVYGGGADEVTLERNRRAVEEIHLLPRVLRDVSNGTTHTCILGKTWRSPLMLAPVAFQKMAHPLGEVATAQAASAMETGMMVSTLASVTMENISDQLSSPKWFQLYWQLDRAFNLALIQRAEAAGYEAIVLTVDSAIHGIRNRAQRAKFALPEGIEAVNLRDRPELPQQVFTPDQSIVFQGMMSEAPNWQDVEWLISHTDLPVIIKGVLHPDDAMKAKSLGAQGVVVSNHGGRTLDCVPSAFEVVGGVRQAVGDDFCILLDGAVQRGTDVFKALALGADAVLVGRPQFYALAVAGAAGVAHMLRILREELEVAMALTGVAQVQDITSTYLYRPT